MPDYLTQVYQWITNPQVWVGAGPVWQVIGVILVTITVLQLLPESFAGGTLFKKEAIWITLILDSLWVFLVFVAPFIPLGATIALIIVVALVVLAILARNHWH